MLASFGSLNLISSACLNRKEERAKRQRGVYLHIKSEVENCINYLKEKREEDP
jgi:hypothetical protein